MYPNGEISIPNMNKEEYVRKEFFNPFSMKYLYMGYYVPVLTKGYALCYN